MSLSVRRIALALIGAALVFPIGIWIGDDDVGTYYPDLEVSSAEILAGFEFAGAWIVGSLIWPRPWKWIWGFVPRTLSAFLGSLGSALIALGVVSLIQVYREGLSILQESFGYQLLGFGGAIVGVAGIVKRLDRLIGRRDGSRSL